MWLKAAIDYNPDRLQYLLRRPHLSRWEKYHRKKFKEMQEKVHRLAKDAVKGKTPEEIERLIDDWQTKFARYEEIKTDLDKKVRTIFVTKIYREIAPSLEVNKELPVLLSDIKFKQKIKDEKRSLVSETRDRFLSSIFQKEKLNKLNQDADDAFEEYYAAQEKLKTFVLNVIILKGQECVETDYFIMKMATATAEMAINYPSNRYEGFIPVTTAKEVIDFIADKANLPTVEIAGDDWLIYKFQKEFYQHLKKAIPNAEKQKKLARLKAQAAKNREEQRGLSGSLRSDKNFQKQINKFNFCPYCETQFNSENLNDKIHMDHIYPVSKGGHSVIENLVFICEQCNIKKSDQTLTRFCLSTGFETDNIVKRLLTLDKDI